MRMIVLAAVVAAALLGGPTHASEQQPAPADQLTGGEFDYVVQPGDYLIKIGARFGLAAEVGSVDAVHGELESNSGMPPVIGFKRSNSSREAIVSSAFVLRAGPVRVASLLSACAAAHPLADNEVARIVDRIARLHQHKSK